MEIVNSPVTSPVMPGTRPAATSAGTLPETSQESPSVPAIVGACTDDSTLATPRAGSRIADGS